MHQDTRRPRGVRKIAVLRANAIGDFVFALPALDALRAAFPGAEVIWLGQPWHAGFLAGRRGLVDRAVAVPACRGVWEPPGEPEDPAAQERFFAAMAEERFDLAIQMHGGGRHSNPFVRRLRARLTAGPAAPDAEPLDRTLPYVYYQNEVHRNLEIVGLVGARPVGFEPRLEATPRDLAESRKFVPDGPAPIAVLHPGAGDPRRRWPTREFAEVGDALAGAGARVVVTGARDEAPLARAVVGAMRRPALDACGRLSLEGLIGLFARCKVAVSNDSGSLHLAGAAGAATVGIYWCGNLITAGPPTRARHRPAVSWRLDCPECGVDCTRGRCDHRASFVADVPVAEVAAPALELLATPDPW